MNEKRLEKNTKIAKEALQLVTKRTGSQAPLDQFADMVNVIGIIAAEILFLTATAPVEGLQDQISEIIKGHIDNAQSQVVLMRAKEGQVH